MNAEPAPVIDINAYIETKKEIDEIISAGEIKSTDRDLYRGMVIQITRKRLGLPYDGRYVIDEKEGE